MSTRTATIIVEAELAADYAAASKAKRKKALSAMRQALRSAPTLKAKASRLSKRETELFLRINRTLPEDRQQRYEELTEKSVEETLSKNERAELLKLNEKLQEIWAERWKAVIDLAKLRKISPQEMMRELGVDPEKYG